MSFSIYFLCFLFGVLLGCFFFGGLSWTVKKGLESKRPWLFFLPSFFIRMCLVMLGFFWVTQGDYKRLFLALVGFHLGRMIIQKMGVGKDASQP